MTTVDRDFIRAGNCTRFVAIVNGIFKEKGFSSYLVQRSFGSYEIIYNSNDTKDQVDKLVKKEMSVFSEKLRQAEIAFYENFLLEEES